MSDTSKAGREAMLLKVGERLFSSQGYKAVSVEAICHEAGIATGSFYNYFPSKDAFYARIISDMEARGIEQADRIARSLKSPLNQLKALYRFTILGIRKSPMLRGVLTGNRRYTFPGWMEFSGRTSALHEHLRGLLDRILADGTRKRVFRSGRYRDPSAMIVAIMDTMLPRLDEADSATLMDDLLTLLERGLKRTLRLKGWEERKDSPRRRRRRARRTRQSGLDP